MPLLYFENLVYFASQNWLPSWFLVWHGQCAQQREWRWQVNSKKIAKRVVYIRRKYMNVQKVHRYHYTIARISFKNTFTALGLRRAEICRNVPQVTNIEMMRYVKECRSEEEQENQCEEVTVLDDFPWIKAHFLVTSSLSAKRRFLPFDSLYAKNILVQIH